jgi:hypothetical protein
MIGVMIVSLLFFSGEKSVFAGDMSQKKERMMIHKDAGPKFDESGELLRPEGYRKWIFVGGPVTPNELNEGKAAFPEFHHVYIDPAGYYEYKKTGKFRDGTIFVKELVNVGAKKGASGNGYFPGEFSGVIAASVKDSKRFPDEPGNWAYFDFGKDKKKAKALPASSCSDCHKAHANEDLVFTQFYPVLRAARPE